MQSSQRQKYLRQTLSLIMLLEGIYLLCISRHNLRKRGIFRKEKIIDIRRIESRGISGRSRYKRVN